MRLTIRQLRKLIRESFAYIMHEDDVPDPTGPDVLVSDSNDPGPDDKPMDGEKEALAAINLV